MKTILPENFSLENRHPPQPPIITVLPTGKRVVERCERPSDRTAAVVPCIFLLDRTMQQHPQWEQGTGTRTWREGGYQSTVTSDIDKCRIVIFKPPLHSPPSHPMGVLVQTLKSMLITLSFHFFI